jgi:hypothetical protein
MATVTPAHQLAVANLYSALFNRAPDAAGFAFWTQALADGASPFSIAATFVATPEARTTYAAALTAERYVALFYTTVLGRAPDADGLAFWLASLNAAGGIGSDNAKAQLLSQIIDLVSTPLPTKPDGLSDAQYAQTLADRALFLNKSTVGVYFASDLKGTDLSLAKQILGAVTAEPASIDLAKGIATGTAGNGGGSGVIGPAYHYLTTGTDTLVGGAGQDVFVANMAEVIPNISDGVATLAAGDSIDGGAGIDRLNLRGAANISAFATADIRNVEQVYTDMNADLDVSSNADVKEVWMVGGEATGTAVTLRKDQLAGITGPQAHTVRFTFTDSAGSADSATLALADTTGLTRLLLQNIESLTINASGTNIINNISATATESLTVTGTGRLTTGVVSGNYKVVDASANTGGLIFDMSRLASVGHRIIGSTAQDEITINAANLTAADDIDLGAGFDTLGFSEGNVLLDSSTAANFSGIKNVEAFKFNGAITATVDGGATAISTFLVNTTGLVTFTRLASSDIIMIGGVNAAANHYSMDAGQSIFGIFVAGTDAAISRAYNQVVTGSSVISIASTGSAAQAANELSITADDGNNMLVVGATDLTLSVANAGGVLGQTINASSFGGKLAVTGTASSDVITGGAGDDTINGGQTTFGVTAASAVTAVAEQQTVSISGGFGANTSTTFLGVSIFHGVNFNSDQMALLLQTNKAAILAGSVAQAAGITDIVRTGAFTISLVFTAGDAGSALAGPRDSLAASPTDNGYNFSAGSRTIAGVYAAPAVTAVAQSVDTLTGGDGADTFVFENADHDNAHGGLTAIITDFKTGQDKIKVANIGAANADNFASAQTSAADLAALLTAADNALDGTVKIYVGRVGFDSYVVTDVNGNGYTDVIKLTGVGSNGVVAADFIA